MNHEQWQNARRLEGLIQTMEIPPRRKAMDHIGNLRWLAKNLAERNRKHPNFTAAVEILKELVGERAVED